MFFFFFFFFSSRRRHTRCLSDWSSDVCSSDLAATSGGCSGRRLCVRERRPSPARRRRLKAQTPKLLQQIGAVGAALGVYADLGVLVAAVAVVRSEERRVGKECRS